MADQRVVVVGLGYVGLPLVQAAVKAGFHVTGYDVSSSVVDTLNGGRSHVDDLSSADVAELLALGFTATTDSSVIAGADVVVTCVPTPLSSDGGPDLGAVMGATRDIAANLSTGTLVVLESTTYPGTTEEVCLPILETSGLRAGIDFDLAFSPERIDPGNKVFTITSTPKVVGGMTQRATERATDFYGAFVAKVVVAKGTREAELAKLLENTYRHVNIAMMNELAELCDLLDIDLWNAIDCAASKPFGYQAFYPGPGVGGHCIPIDPNYLSHHVKSVLGRPFRFVELAQEINSGMPSYVFRRAQDALNTHAKPLRGSRILLLGVTYKANIADERESPARPLARALIDAGADVAFADPYVAQWNVDSEHGVHDGDRLLERAADIDVAVAAADIVIVLQSHAAFDFDLVVSKAQLVLDTRGRLDGANVIRM